MEYSLPAAKRDEYARAAVEMANAFHRARGVTAFSQTFLTADVLVPLLAYFERTASELRRGSGAPGYQAVFYASLADFAAMNHRDPYASQRFADTAEAARAFVVDALDPVIVANSATYKHEEYLYDMARKGIDVNNRRVAARDPTILSRGRPALKGGENRGVGAMQLRTDGYFLSHPNAGGRERQRAALARMGYTPAPLAGPGGCPSLHTF